VTAEDSGILSRSGQSPAYLRIVGNGDLPAVQLQLDQWLMQMDLLPLSGYLGQEQGISVVVAQYNVDRPRKGILYLLQ